ncbi:hypothetical protein K438DRAFT_1817805 [Mycena galopus ATCC 62051]|nr:hypothetical protein K438DRAFT_1817805 [Mycena galopus ATCC 62051]
MSKVSSQPLLVNASAGAGPPHYQPHPGMAYHTIPVNVNIHLEAQAYGYRRSPLRRFCVAFLVAVSLWVLIKAIIMHHHLGFGHGTHWGTPSNLVVDQCVSGSALPMHGNSPDAVFDVPLSPETVLLVSRYQSSSFFGAGSSLSGSFDVSTSMQLDDKMGRIVVHSLHGTEVQVCLMTGTHGEIGVGLFNRGSWWPGYGKFLKIDLMLPHARTPVQLKGIIAELPNFSLNVGNLADTVVFGSATFKTSNAAVRVESMTAGHAQLHSSNGRITADSFVSSDLDIKTSNAGISGTFNTSTTLHLTTSNAPITVTVGLENSPKTRRTTLMMRTSNNRIDANVSLFTDARKGGDFGITGTTSNGRVNIAVPASPIDSALDLTARTSNAAAELTLHRAYQGSLTVSTSNNYPEIKRLNEKEDGRQFEYSQMRGHGHGYVYAKGKEANKKLGNVVVKTSNAPVVLFV